jgi:hypothetical protein
MSKSLDSLATSVSQFNNSFRAMAEDTWLSPSDATIENTATTRTPAFFVEKLLVLVIDI